MPIGITTDVLITCLGAVLGVVLGTRLPDSLKKALNNTIGIAAIAMGIVLILKVKNLSAVVLTLVIGSILGELVMLDDRIRKLVTGVVHKLMNGAAADEQFLAQVSAVVILFCCGGTGWYGALNEGLTGDGSILITKSILDFVTACIFGSILGKIVPMLCIPQAIIYGALFLVSGAVQSFITPDIIADFSATGGIITLCAGLSLAGIKKETGSVLLQGKQFLFLQSVQNPACQSDLSLSGPALSACFFFFLHHTILLKRQPPFRRSLCQKGGCFLADFILIASQEISATSRRHLCDMQFNDVAVAFKS